MQYILDPISYDTKNQYCSWCGNPHLSRDSAIKGWWKSCTFFTDSYSNYMIIQDINWVNTCRLIRKRALLFWTHVMKQIHGIIHILELQAIAGRHIHFGQPSIPYTKFGIGFTKSVGCHSQQNPFVRYFQLFSPSDIFNNLYKAKALPKRFNDQWAT